MRKSFSNAIDKSVDKIQQAYKHRYNNDPLFIGGPTTGAELRILHLRKIQRIFNSSYKRSLAITKDYEDNPTELNARRLEKSKSNMADCVAAMAHANSMTSGMPIEQVVTIGEDCKRHTLRC